MSDPEEFVEAHADVFETVANDTRLSILLQMIIRQNESGPLAYSEIMDAVGIEDSGRFNYHLDRLRDYFVDVDGDNYLPTMGAHKLANLIYTGKLVDDTTVDTETVGASCQRCGSPLVAGYDYDFSVQCQACDEERLRRVTGPLVARDRPLRTLAREADSRMRAHVRALLESSCLQCGGTVSVAFTDARERFYRRQLLDTFVSVRCDRCYDGVVYLTVGQFLLGHPTVQRYCRDEGIALDERTSWRYTWTRSDGTTEVRSRDPWEIEKYAFADGCKLVAVLEDDGSVSHLDHVRIDG